MPVIAANKRASFDYEIIETVEAGLVLSGQEVKSIKTGHVKLEGAHIVFKRGKRMREPYLLNCYIPPYKFAGEMPEYDPMHSRRILLKKREIERFGGKKEEQGLTLIPIKIYTKNSFLKLEIGLGRGRKKYDKRELIKNREVDRRLRTLKKRNQ